MIPGGVWNVVSARHVELPAHHPTRAGIMVVGGELRLVQVLVAGLYTSNSLEEPELLSQPVKT